MASPDLPAAAQELKDKGNKCFGEKDYDQALAHYTSALGEAPGNPVLLSNLAATHLALRQWKKALERAEECLAADPSFLKAYGRKAAAQMGLFRPGDAEKTLRTGVARDPTNQFLKSELERLLQEEDGDQSPQRIRDGSALPLRRLQALMADALHPFAEWPNDTFMAGFVGDEKVFLKSFRPEHLRLWALEMRMPLTSVVVAGAQRIRLALDTQHERTGRFDSDSARGLGHANILRRLIEAGARVNARDAMGYTALHHATSCSLALDLAEILIEAGADVNVQDRFGVTPLIGAVMVAEPRSVRLLLKHGARTDIKDNDGRDVLGLSLFNMEIQSMLYKAHESNRRPGEQRQCANCGKEGAKKACGGCGGAINYCSRECQTAHWPTHKLQCRKGQAGAAGGATAAASAAGTSGGSSELPHQVVVSIEVVSGPLFNNQATMDNMDRIAGIRDTGPRPGKYKPPVTLARDSDSGAKLLAQVAARGTKKNAIKIKIQVLPKQSEQRRKEMMQMGLSPDTMLCYNEDRSLVCQIDGSTGGGLQIANLIREKGIMGLKGYFAAFFDDRCARKGDVPCEMVIFTSMLSAQPF
ncbi:hypothetical protein VaNZ11_001347 [Volvox africanus]|uniref:MYND-type domain-containing protein n=1 Tax=Volvox africanus TaxID=51714 RepID=A0ABQ5RQD8_9CHLO|nr:hypothetical protein VaNZ11_001347 [Volvox africanus]